MASKKATKLAIWELTMGNITPAAQLLARLRLSVETASKSTERNATLATRMARITVVVRLSVMCVAIAVTESLMKKLERPVTLDISSTELPVQTAQQPAQPNYANTNVQMA